VLIPDIDGTAAGIGGREAQSAELWEEHGLRVYKYRVFMKKYYMKRE